MIVVPSATAKFLLIFIVAVRFYCRKNFDSLPIFPNSSLLLCEFIWCKFMVTILCIFRQILFLKFYKCISPKISNSFRDNLKKYVLVVYWSHHFHFMSPPITAIFRARTNFNDFYKYKCLTRAHECNYECASLEEILIYHPFIESQIFVTKFAWRRMYNALSLPMVFQ